LEAKSLGPQYGRLTVDNYLRVVNYENVFAAGDVAHAAVGDNTHYTFMSCQHAISLGRYAGNNSAAQLIGTELLPYHQEKYVTCLDLGEWGALYTEGWQRSVKLIKQEAKVLKHQINTIWIYPPEASKEIALAASDPSIPIV
jgi:NADH dehydrogenase